jgi:hypothetical protein
MFSAIQEKAKDFHICLLGSSCTKHMTLHKEWFHNLEPLPSLEDIYLSHGKSQQTKGMRSISLFLELVQKLDVQNVFYVHGLTQSLMSLGKFVTLGMKLKFEDDVCWISAKDVKKICENTIKKKGNLYQVGVGIVVETSIYCPKLMDMHVELNFSFLVLRPYYLTCGVSRSHVNYNNFPNFQEARMVL